jgi:hypothetical protein
VTLAKKKICDFALSLIFFLFFKGGTRLNSRAVGTRGDRGALTSSYFDRNRRPIKEL